MENKKLIKILRKDMGELEELIGEVKAGRHFDLLEMEFIHTRAKGLQQLLQLLDSRGETDRKEWVARQEEMERLKEIPGKAVDPSGPEEREERGPEQEAGRKGEFREKPVPDRNEKERDVRPKTLDEEKQKAELTGAPGDKKHEEGPSGAFGDKRRESEPSGTYGEKMSKAEPSGVSGERKSGTETSGTYGEKTQEAGSSGVPGEEKQGSGPSGDYGAKTDEEGASATYRKKPPEARSPGEYDKTKQEAEPSKSFARGAGKENTVKDEDEEMLDETPDQPEKGRLLGDSFLKGKSVNDLISEQQKMEYKFSNRPVSSIQAAIGINDRFQYIRELFDGNNEKFLEAVKALDSMQDIHEAVDYLRHHFKWKKNETSLKFVNLVKRRFHYGTSR